MTVPGGEVIGLDREAPHELRTRFGGEILLPAHEGYDEARRVWNSMVDRRPGAIVRPADAAEVSAAIGFARDRDLLLAVRWGGHSLPGFSTCDGGLVLDLSLMRKVEVDPVAGLARAAGGAQLGATAFPGRRFPFAYDIVAVWTDPDEDDRYRDWVRGVVRELEQLGGTGTYVNVEADTGEDVTRAAYGSEKYERLVALKNTYDPTNL